MSGAGSLFVALVVVALVACALPSAHCDSVNFDVAAAITKWLPPLNTFSSVGDISSLNSAYQFGKYRQRLRCLYTSLAPETANYHVFELVENDVLVKITLYRSVNPDETRFYPGIVLMGPDRLNIDKGTQNPPNYFPSIVDVPVGYDTYVRWENSKEDFLPIYQGIIPFTWYQMLTFNVSTLEPGLYVIAVFNSIVDGSTPGAYALALGYSINITFDDFMLGPFHAYFTYEWQGFGGGLILLPYFIIIGIGVLIIAHQTFWRGNSPRTWYSMFVFWGGLLIIGSGCVVAEFLAFAFLQQPSPIPESINPSVIWTALMLALPLIVGILICFFGLMIKVNLLVRVIVLFLAVGSCLVWASYYVGPAIAILGALLPAKRLPLHRLPFCGDYFRRFDEDLSGRRRNYVDHDGDWDEDYDDEDDKKQSKSDKKKGGKKDNKGKKTAAPAASSTAAAASSAAAAASSSAASSASGEKPFPVEEVGIQFVGGDDDDTESDPNEDEAVARAASVNSVVAAQNGQIDREDASSDFDA